MDPLKIDLHGYHPSEIDVENLVMQAWEIGASQLTLIHGHGRNRGISPGFVNTNTGYFGLCVRRAMRRNSSLKPWAKVSTLDCSQDGSTTIQLRHNPAPSRTQIEMPESA
jgi:hypothetical protein